MVKFTKTVLCSLMLAALAACGGMFDGSDDDGDGGGRGPKGKMRLFLTDAPLEAKEVWVTITGVEMHSTGGGWQSFMTETKSVDLLKFRDGQQTLLDEANLVAGKYTQIRLLVSDGYLIDLQDQRCELKVPSDKVKINVKFDILESTTTRIVLDFDAAQSVHIVRKGNKDECNLRPVIKPVSVTMGG